MTFRRSRKFFARPLRRPRNRQPSNQPNIPEYDADGKLIAIHEYPDNPMPTRGSHSPAGDPGHAAGQHLGSLRSAGRGQVVRALPRRLRRPGLEVAAGLQGEWHDAAQLKALAPFSLRKLFPMLVAKSCR